MSSQKLAIISGNGLNILNIQDKTYDLFLSDNATIYEALFDPTGKYLCYCSNNGSFLVNLNTNDKKILNPSSRCRKITFSPKGTYVCNFNLNNGTTTDDNVFIYNCETGLKIHSYKYGNNGFWAPEFSADEKISIKTLKSEVLIFTDSSFDTFTGKITIKGLEKAAISMCGGRYHIATYVKGTQGMPNMVKIFEHPNLKDPINNRSFFKATEVTLHWSPSGRHLLFLVHNEDTKTNYYGENALYLMSATPGGETALVSMPGRDDGSSAFVHHLDWVPVLGDRFLVTYGNPVRVAMFDTHGEVLACPIDAPNRNMGYFNPSGSAIAMLGMGNVRSSLQLWRFSPGKLLGEIDVADINRVCWSGNGEFLATATVSPSLRVNNGVIVWSVNGSVVIDKETVAKLIGNPSEIYNVMWQRMSADMTHFPIPAGRGAPFYFNAQCQRVEKKQIAAVNSAYVPPHLRNRGDATNVAANGGASMTKQTNSGIRFTNTPQPAQAASKPKKKKTKAKPAANSNDVAPQN